MSQSGTFHFCTFQTAAGRFSLAVDDGGAVAAAAFGGRSALRSRLKDGALVAGTQETAEARGQVEAWFLGKRREFSVRLSTWGTPFQRRVWAALRKIPYGQTRSYGDVARSIGSSPRAVGRANATNPICVIVPCHRVIGSDGSPTGYAFGEERKLWLLKLEGS